MNHILLHIIALKVGYEDIQLFAKLCKISARFKQILFDDQRIWRLFLLQKFGQLHSTDDYRALYYKWIINYDKILDNSSEIYCSGKMSPLTSKFSIKLDKPALITSIVVFFFVPDLEFNRPIYFRNDFEYNITYKADNTKYTIQNRELICKKIIISLDKKPIVTDKLVFQCDELLTITSFSVNAVSPDIL